MKMLQFAFGSDDNEYLPCNYVSDNCIVYTGSHDSECTATWCSTIPPHEIDRFNREAPMTEDCESPVDALILAAHKSRANLSVVPIQDYLGLTSEEARINTPSMAEGNWAFRLPYGARSKALAAKIARFTALGKRTKESVLE
jgi:4-alpha-glucanotransferase